MVQRKEMFARIWLNIYIISNLKLLCSLYRRNDRIRLAKYGIIERNLQLIFTRIFFRFFISRMNYSFLGNNTIEYYTKERGFEYLYYKNLYYYLSKCVGTIKFAKFVSSKPSSIYKHQISNARIVPGLSYSFKLNFYRDKRRCVIRPSADSRWMISPGLDRSNRPSLRYFWLWRVKGGGLKRKKKAGGGGGGKDAR